jgi:hypothetical protein
MANLTDRMTVLQGSLELRLEAIELAQAATAAQLQLLVTAAGLQGAAAGGQAAQLAALVSAIGPLASAPANYTVRELLSNILSCVCADPPPKAGSGGTPVDGGGVPLVFEPPPSGCFGAAAAWQECMLQLRYTTTGEGQNYDVYTVVWPTTMGVGFPFENFGAAYIGGTNNPALVDLLEPYASPGYKLCLAYSFTAAPYNALLAANGNVNNLLPFMGYTSMTADPPAEGGLNVTVPTGAGGGRPGAMCNIAFPAGAAPVGKIWAMMAE